MKTIYLAGGCFWGTQKFFDQFDGVVSTEVGYANGPDPAPSYRDVCNSSGHAETVKIDYDEAQIALEDILRYYFMVIDPVSVNRQGNDTGIQYRTGIYYTDPEMLESIRKVYGEEEAEAGVPLAVEVEPLKNFFPAEEYHQKYLDKNPGGYCHIPAKYMRLSEPDMRTAEEEGPGCTMALALFDSVPVAIFIANSLVIYSRCRNKALLIGAVSSAAAGATKVAGKISVAGKGKDIDLIARWFKPLMVSGFSIMTAAVLKEATPGRMRDLLKRTGPRSAALFMTGIAGYGLMGYLGRHLDKSARSNWIEEITNTAAQGAIMAGLLLK